MKKLFLDQLNQFDKVNKKHCVFISRGLIELASELEKIYKNHVQGHTCWTQAFSSKGPIKINGPSKHDFSADKLLVQISLFK